MTPDQGQSPESARIELAQNAEARTAQVVNVLLSWPEFSRGAAIAVLNPRSIDPNWINVNFERLGVEYTASIRRIEIAKSLPITIINSHVEIIRGMDSFSLEYLANDEGVYYGESSIYVGIAQDSNDATSKTGIEALPSFSQVFPEFFPPVSSE